MNSLALVGLVSAVFSLALSAFTLFKSRKRVHIIWAAFLFSVALWGFGIYGFASASMENSAIFWWRIAEVGVILIPVLLTHFVAEFLEMPRKKDVYIIYAITFVFLFLNLFTNLFFGDVRFVFNQFYYITPTVAYTMFVTMFLGLVIYNVFKLWQSHKEKQGLLKTQIKYLIFAFSVGFLGGATSFLTVYYVDIYPAWNITIFLSSLILTYAIFKHQLMDIKAFAAQLFIIALNLIAFIYIFISEGTREYVIKIIFFFGTLFISILLYKSFNKEVHHREELQVMTNKLENANEQLKKLDRAKSEFISIASHQLRTPLTSIKGYVSLIMEETYGKIDKKIKEALSKVYVSNERLIQLVDNLLNISRIESGKIEYKYDNWQIENIINELIDNFIFSAKKKNLYLHLDLPRHPLSMIKIDGAKIKEVISNVIDNAIKYTNKGGVTIKAEEVKDKIRVIVSDTGIGIPKNEISYVFTKFSRGHDISRLQTSGTGLGMYVGKSLVEAQNGKIWVESKGEGKGSKFIIELPMNLHIRKNASKTFK